MKIMKHLNKIPLTLLAICSLFLAADALAAPPAEPARIQLQLAPVEVAAGEQTQLNLMLTPIDGVKINRYPKIKLKIEAQDGVVAAAETAVGNEKAPAPGEMDKNYFKTVDPLALMLSIDPAAKAGTHELEAKLTYFYCVSASGFCAPKTVPVKFAVKVR